MQQPIHLKICYDLSLQKITGKALVDTVISNGSTFSYLLMNIFMEHPEIEIYYPPGTLGMTINGIPPKLDSPLSEGDMVELTVVTHS